MNTEDWNAVLRSTDVDTRLEALQQAGTLKGVFPEVSAMVGFGGGDQGHKDLWNHTKRVVKQTKPITLLRWAALFHDVGKPVSFSKEHGKVTFHQHEAASVRLFDKAMRRTGLLKGDARKRVRTIIYNLGLAEAYTSEWTDSAVRRLYKELGDTFHDTLLLSRADVTTKHDHKREAIHRSIHELEQRAEALAIEDAKLPPLPKGLGEAIISTFGIPPSKQVGDLMKVLKAQVEAEKLEPHQEHSYYVKFLLEHRDEFGL